MYWTVMAVPRHHRFPPNGTLEAPLPPVRGFFFQGKKSGVRATNSSPAFSGMASTYDQKVKRSEEAAAIVGLGTRRPIRC